MNNEQKFYLKMFLIVAAAFFIWVFGSSENKKNIGVNVDKAMLNDKPAALENFIPPSIIVFKDPDNVFPKRNWSASPLELSAEAAIAVKSDGSRVYYNKNINKRRPVASLTKLMTAAVVLENYNLDDVVKIEKKYIKREGETADLRPGEKITVRSLLETMLIDSSNDAAFALAGQKSDFINLMNGKAKELNLYDTHFTNPDGLDEPNNYSSAFDVSKIFGYLADRHPDVLEILKTKNLVVYSSDGAVEHRLANTNELLGTIPEIEAGKTGYTDEAGGSLALLISGSDFGGKNNIITVILGSPDRFGESEKFLNWLKKAYYWK